MSIEYYYKDKDHYARINSASDGAT